MGVLFGIVALPVILISCTIGWWKRVRWPLAAALAVLSAIAVALCICYFNWEVATKNPWPTAGRTAFNVAEWCLLVLGPLGVVVSAWVLERALRHAAPGDAENTPRSRR